MTSTGRKGTVVLMGVVAMLVARACKRPGATRMDQREATLCSDVNYAALSRDVLSQAKARVEAVYESHRRRHRVGQRRRESSDNVRTAGCISPSCCSRAK